MSTLLKSVLIFTVLLYLIGCTKSTEEKQEDIPEEKYSIEKAFTYPQISNGQHEVCIQSDGKIIATSSIGPLRRFTKDGAIDATFTPPGLDGGPTSIQDMVVLPDDKILVAGRLALQNGNQYANLMKLNKDGSVDPDFHPFAFSSGSPNAISLQQDGKIVIAGAFQYIVGGTPHYHVARLNTDGTYDVSFISHLGDYSTIFGGLQSLVVNTDGKIMIAGEEFRKEGSNDPLYVARLNSDGSFDESFHLPVKLFRPGGYAQVLAMNRQSDGKFLIGGTFTSMGTDLDHTTTSKIVRLNTDGSIDNSFVSPLNKHSYSFVMSIQTMDDSKILIGEGISESDSSFFSIVSNIGASVDSTIGFSKGSVYKIVRESPSSYILAGIFYGAADQYGLLRLKKE